MLAFFLTVSLGMISVFSVKLCPGRFFIDSRGMICTNLVILRVLCCRFSKHATQENPVALWSTSRYCSTSRCGFLNQWLGVFRAGSRPAGPLQYISIIHARIIRSVKS